MAPKKRNLDVLGDLCGSDSDDSASEGKSAPPPKKPAAASSAKLSMEALERAGYTSGPSVLHVPEQRDVEDTGVWEWSTGRNREAHDAEPTQEERQHMRQATQGVQADAEYARKALEHTAKMREDKKQEKEERAKKSSLTWKEKEKRKRDRGMQSSGATLCAALRCTGCATLGKAPWHE